MADILVRDVPDEVLTALDERARELGRSRSEFLRRQLAVEARRRPVAVEDLTWFAEAFADLAAPVMDDTWDRRPG